VRTILCPGFHRADHPSGDDCARSRANLPVSFWGCRHLSHATPGRPDHSNMAAKSRRLQLHLGTQRGRDCVGGPPPQFRLPTRLCAERHRLPQGSPPALRPIRLARPRAVFRLGALGPLSLLSIRRLPRRKLPSTGLQSSRHSRTGWRWSRVVAVLTPICVERFQANAVASANLVALKNISHSWERRDYIVKGGWATFGQERPFELADACAEALNKL
jgi:hypothetical protein